jgi:hypothetical protein
MSRGVRAINLKKASKAKDVEEQEEEEEDGDDDFIIQAEDDDDEDEDEDNDDNEGENEIVDSANDDEPLVASVEHFKGGETKVAGMAIIPKSIAKDLG